MTGAIKTLEDYLDEKIVSLETREFKYLPLCHTTTFEHCADIAKNGLQESKCDLKYDPQIFLFYGKSRYQVDKALGNIKYDIEKMPAALLFDCASLIDDKIKFKRFLPFDSGGFDRYGLSLGRENFEIGNRNKSTKLIELIRLIYTNHQHYLNDEVNSTDLSPEASENETVKELKEFYTKEKYKNPEYGLQALAIEVQANKEFKTQPEVLLVPYLAVASARKKFKEIIQEIKAHYKDVKIVSYFDKHIPDDLFQNFQDIDSPKTAKSNGASEEYVAIYDGSYCEVTLRTKVKYHVVEICQKPKCNTSK